MAVKTQLSGLGGSWNRGLKGYILPQSRKESVLSLLREDPTNSVSESGTSEPPAAKKAKKSKMAADDSGEEDETEL